MKLPSKKSPLAARRSSRRKVILAAPPEALHRVRKSVLKRAERLMKDRNYPRHTIVVELAKLFTSKIISERN